MFFSLCLPLRQFNYYTLLRLPNHFVYIAFLLVAFFSSVSLAVRAQAVPDTSMNKVIPDSALSRSQRSAAITQTPLPVPTPVVDKKKEKFQPNAKKSGLYSAILPGSGQFYNQQYWKVPVIYAGIGVATYFLIDNQKNYRKYRKIYVARLQGDRSDKEPYTDADIKTLQDEYKKYLDMTVLLTAVGYTLQVIDAITFAHLKNFDISPDISARFAPVATPNGIGVGLVVHFN